MIHSLPGGAVARATAALDRIETSDRPEIWISLRTRDELLEEAAAIDAKVAGGEVLPLAGRLLAVKDNIDVCGLPTTAGAPSFAYRPTADATAVARLRAAGALVVGKTNLDQFATGLVGTRSPYGAVRNAWDPNRISGGSSSGSAVAVALGLVDLALGTDTAGSGRVPAALNGIVGVKPSRGLVPVTGVVPACYTLDCVTVFARDLGSARAAAELMAGPDPADPLSRTLPPGAGPPPVPRVAVPTGEHLDGLAPGWAAAFQGTVARLASAGVEVVEVDISPLLEAARLLYEGAFVAERYAAVGSHLEANRDLVGTGLDPTVTEIVLAGASATAAVWARDVAVLARLGAEGRAALAGCSALLTPTTTWHPTLLEVADDPVGANARLGRYTNFANLLDMASLAVPAGQVDGLPFGVMLTGAAGSDRTLAALGHALLSPSVDLFVVGAHLSGMPLNHQLVEAGATLLRPAATSADYRLFALDTVPPKPGLVRVGPRGAGVRIEGELWRVPAASFGAFVGGVPAPMAIGKVGLADGSEVSGFLVEPFAVEGAADISSYGGWRRYR
ncbi:allophanate hydrolase [Nocardioides albus]|uniref:Allophanate hydrolase n=1 Tax=Nocardioides albus TaxID=1841 RepID=A0A7W5FAM1_9ACTN|nr:allophanate hydrolase [Nocardioides albus]MBB3091448.1 allophanate hydrolase [Nocardioides albus]GGU41724.1 amidase [Nocardioides albus]